MNCVYLNGEFVNSEDATISVYDQGFLYGDGIFETQKQEFADFESKDLTLDHRQDLFFAASVSLAGRSRKDQKWWISCGPLELPLSPLRWYRPPNRLRNR